MADVVLKMKGITKVFIGVVALNQAEIEVERGEVHALIGENGAGKSTLMNILIGIHKKDGGTILYDGKEVEFTSPTQALEGGISMIHQEIRLVSKMSVAENIWLGREQLFTKFGMIDRSKRWEMTKDLFAKLDISIDPSEIIEQLSIAQMQLVEIARAVSYKPKVIIMDEPTSALTNREVQKLYSIIRSLTAEGTSVLFISHKLEELYEICQRVTVMRDGCYIGTYGMNEVSQEELIAMIAGRKLDKVFNKKKTEFGDVVFEVKDLSRAGVFKNVNFSVRKGEVLGFCGLMGAGRSEILRAVFGIDPKSGGHIYLEGREIRINSIGDAVRQGIGMVTEDRLRLGVIHTMSVMHNATLAVFYRLCNRLGYNKPAQEMDAYKKKANELAIKCSSPRALIGELSGGNQQKVIIERWLLTDSKVLFLDEPTRGIDVGTKSEIYSLIDRLAKQGMAIVMISSEMPELLSLCDRIMVVHDGQIVYEVEREEATQDTLMNYAFGL